jgi:DNA repair exonuclease SbcCD nuclease subunit
MEELSNKKYDYWALGHIHKREKVNEEIGNGADKYLCYSCDEYLFNDFVTGHILMKKIDEVVKDFFLEKK